MTAGQWHIDDITFWGWSFTITPQPAAERIVLVPVDPSTPRDVVAALATTLDQIVSWLDQQQGESGAPMEHT
jgi:hypothetical protein